MSGIFGQKNPTLEVRDGRFRPYAEVGVDGVGTLYVGRDLRLYRKTTGLTQVISPCEPMKNTEPEAWLDGVRWEDFPPMGELRHLYETFLQGYDREVMFVIGKKWDDSGWFYMVPEQEGTSVSIDWEDKEGMQEMFSVEARWIGTCHIHPGSGCDPSGTDIANWEKPEQSGLHVIFGRGGDFSVTGSAAGFSMPLLKGNIADTEAIETVLRGSMDRPLKNLLKVPPPPPSVCYGPHRCHSERDDRNVATRKWVSDLWDEKREEREIDKVVERPVRENFGGTFCQVGALLCEEKDLRGLRMIRHDGQVYLLTKAMFEAAETMHKRGLPPSTVLKIERKGKG